MQLGYNTNGFAHHDLVSAIEILAEIGYTSVAITVDHGSLNPFDDQYSRQVDRVRRLLERHRLRSVIESGARFLLDPRAKHEPTLITADATARGRRIDFLRRCLELAANLGSDCMSCWAGILPAGESEAAGFDRLCEAMGPVLEAAEGLGVAVGFEPEPGMLVDDMHRFATLVERVAHPRMALTLDVGHLHCQGETAIAGQIRQWSPQLVNVHIEDMRVGVHEHLMFGEGEIDFPPIIRALHEVGYAGGIHVELSRHSHVAPWAAARAYEFLRPLMDNAAQDNAH